MSEIQENKQQVQEEVISLKDLILRIQDWIKYLWSKWYILLIAGLVGGGLGCWYAKSKKPVYTATTTFVLESGEKGGLGQYAGMAAMVGIDLGGSTGGIFQGDNLLELYRSRKMIEAALLKPSKIDTSKLIINLFLELNATEELWKENSPYLLDIDFGKRSEDLLTRSRDSIIQNVVNSINKNNLIVAKLDNKLSIIKVDVESTNEIFSQEFNEAIVDVVNTFYIRTKTKKSLDNIDILQNKTDSVRSIMNENISSGASALDATPNLNPTRQSQRIIPTQTSQFSVEANKAILSQLIQNLEMTKMALMKETPLIQIIDDPRFPLVVKSVGTLKAVAIGFFLFSFLGAVFLVLRKLYFEVVY